MSKSARAFLYFVLLLCLLWLPSSLHATGRVECNSIPSKILNRRVPYCIVLPPFDVNKARHFPILYFFHGLGDNEQFFVHSGAWNLVEDMRDTGELKEFLIATPDARSTFYINARDGKERYEDFLVQEFFPYVESHYRAAPGRANRAVSGISMGGYGALHLAFRHPQLFAAVGAHSAALIEKMPNISTEDSRQIGRLRVLGDAFGSPFDPAFWDRNNPFTLARNGPRPVGMKMYFDCGTEDDFGFNRGAQAFHDLLVSRGIPHEFHLYPGGHDISYFAEHLPASFEFQSHAFFH